MNDFGHELAQRLLVRFLTWIIERVATAAYASDVVHNILERCRLRGCAAAARSAIGALPSAVGSRISALPLTLETKIGNLPELAAALFFSMLFTWIYDVTPSLYLLLFSSFRHGGPIHAAIAAPVASIAAGMIVLGALLLGRWASMSVHDGLESSSRASLIALILCVGWFGVYISRCTLAILQPTEPGWHIALSYAMPLLFALPALLGVIAIGHALDTTLGVIYSFRHPKQEFYDHRRSRQRSNYSLHPAKADLRIAMGLNATPPKRPSTPGWPVIRSR